MAQQTHGPAHNANFFREHFQPNPLFSSYILKSQGAGEFVGDFTGEHVSSMARLLSVIRFCGAGVEDYEDAAYAHACLELMIPLTASANFPPRQDARTILLKAVRLAYSNQAIKRETMPNVNGNRFINVLNREFPVPAAADREVAPAPDYLEDFRQAGALGDANLVTTMSYEQALALLQVAACIEYPDFRSVSITLAATMVVALCKQGNATGRALTKIKNDVIRDLNIETDLRAPVIQIVYKHGSANISADNIGALLEQYVAWIPATALRMRLVIQQASFVNLTSFITIGRAIRLFADFPWNEVAGLYETDFINYSAAVGLVHGNQYYGFNRDLGAARSTLYQNLAWVAKTLLIREHGETSLNNARCFVAVPARAEAINRIIDTYCNQRRDAGDAAVNDELSEQLVNIVNQDFNDNVFAL